MERAKGKLQALIDLWQEKRGARAMPSRDDLPVSALRPWLGNLALIDLTGATPYFRLCGTSLHGRFGGEITKRKVDSLDDRLGRNELQHAIVKVQQTHRPVHTTYEHQGDTSKTIFHELFLPLGHDASEADTVLFASFAEQKR